MARAKSPAEELLTIVLKDGVTPPLKRAGFRKVGNNYFRRHGQTTQVVNLQVSHGSSWSEKTFYINVGIAFDAMCELLGLPVLEQPKEHECDRRGTRDRLGSLIAEPPEPWILRADEDVTNTS